MTLDCWMTAMRCMRLSQRGQTMTSTESTLSRSWAQGTQRHRMILPLRDCGRLFRLRLADQQEMLFYHR